MTDDQYKYKIESDTVQIGVKIEAKKGQLKRYILEFPAFKKATLALLDDVRRRLITEVPVSSSEILDPKVINSLKQKFADKAHSIVVKLLPNSSQSLRQILVGKLLNELVSFGEMEYLLNDPELEEIIVNSSGEPVRVYHKKFGWLETNITMDSEERIQNYSNTIARRVGRQVTTLNPLLDAHLTTGDRANAVLYPISNKGHTITIRKFARDPWTVTDLITNKTASAETFALIWLAFQYEMNVLISGGTGSGKTSILGVCMPFIPPTDRIISIEDTRELQLPKFLYWCPLTTRQPNPEGKGEINMLDLLVNALRMRPDRIILGEMRRKQEAEVLFEAMHTGHSVYATVHADSCNETIQRLTNPPIEVPANLLGAVNLNLVMFRERRRGIRRVYQLGEFIVNEESGRMIANANVLYRWKPTTDEIIEHGHSLKFFEDLSRHTGMSHSEISKDLDIKKKILSYMVKNKIRSLDHVGKIIMRYYTDKDFIIDNVLKNCNPSILLKGE